MFTTFKKITVVFFLSILVFSCKNEVYVVTKITAKTIAIDSALASVNSITETIAPYKEKMISEINTVISYTKKDILRTDGDLESSLGNLMADLSYERVDPIFKKQTGKNIDFALFNYGGIRAGIKAGNVKNRHAFELMPFENVYVVVELNGEKITELVQYLIKGDTAHPLSKQVQLTISENSFDLKINNKSFDKSKTYHVLTTDYLQSGGDLMNFFKNPIHLHKIDYKMRDAIVDYFKSVDTIQTVLDNRFKRK